MSNVSINSQTSLFKAIQQQLPNQAKLTQSGDLLLDIKEIKDGSELHRALIDLSQSDDLREPATNLLHQLSNIKEYGSADEQKNVSRLLVRVSSENEPFEIKSLKNRSILHKLNGKLFTPKSEDRLTLGKLIETAKPIAYSQTASIESVQATSEDRVEFLSDISDETAKKVFKKLEYSSNLGISPNSNRSTHKGLLIGPPKTTENESNPIAVRPESIGPTSSPGKLYQQWFDKVGELNGSGSTQGATVFVARDKDSEDGPEYVIKQGVKLPEVRVNFGLAQVAPDEVAGVRAIIVRPDGLYDLVLEKCEELSDEEFNNFRGLIDDATRKINSVGDGEPFTLTDCAHRNWMKTRDPDTGALSVKRIDFGPESYTGNTDSIYDQIGKEIEITAEASFIPDTDYEPQWY